MRISAVWAMDMNSYQLSTKQGQRNKGCARKWRQIKHEEAERRNAK